MNMKIMAAVLAMVAFIAAFTLIPTGDGGQVQGDDVDSSGYTEVSSPQIVTDRYELTDQSILFSEGGSITISSGATLVIGGSFDIAAGSEMHDVIILAEGSSVEFMDRVLQIPQETAIGLSGDFSLGYYAADGGFIANIDISDGGRIALMDGVITGGQDTEVVFDVMMDESLEIQLAMDVPSASGTLVTDMIGSILPDSSIPIPPGLEVQAEAVSIAADILVTIGENGMSVTDSEGNPAYVSVASASGSMMGMEFEATGILINISLDGGSDLSVTVVVDSARMSLGAEDPLLSMRVSDIAMEMNAIPAGATGETEVEGSVIIGAVEVRVQGADEGTHLTATTSDLEAALSILMVSNIDPETFVTTTSVSGTVTINMDSGAVSGLTDGIYVLEGSVNGFSAIVQLEEDGSATVTGVVDSVQLYNGSDDRSDILTSVSVEDAGFSVEPTVDVTGSMTFDGRFYASRLSTYQVMQGYVHPEQTLDATNIEVVTDPTGTTISFDDLSLQTPTDTTYTFTESMTNGSIFQGAYGTSITAANYRIDATGIDGSDGFMEVTGYDLESNNGASYIYSGNFVISFGHDTYGAMADSMFFLDTALTFGEGIAVELRDTYLPNVYFIDAVVDGTAYFCATEPGMEIYVGGQLLTAAQYSDFDVKVTYSDSDVTSVTLVLPNSIYTVGEYSGFQEYGGTGVPYTLIDGGTAAIVDIQDLGNGVLTAGLVTSQKTVTINGVAQTYDFGETIPVVSNETHEGMDFVGWYDGCEIYPAGSSLIVLYDATVSEVWVPSEYVFSYEDGICSVDIGSSGVFHVSDGSALASVMAANGASTLQVSNQYGSVSVSADDFVSDGITIVLDVYGRLPYPFMDQIVGNGTAYDVSATSGGTPIDLLASINSEGFAVGMTTYGQTTWESVESSDGRISLAIPAEDASKYYAVVVDDANGPSGDASGNDNTLLYAAIVVVVIIIIVAVALVMSRRKKGI